MIVRFLSGQGFFLRGCFLPATHLQSPVYCLAMMGLAMMGLVMRDLVMSDNLSVPLRILVLCTGNSARSILGEALFNHLGQGLVQAFSAGSRPVGRVNPLALEVLAEQGIVPADPRSKSWDEFTRPDAPVLDVLITVCDSAAGEICPLFYVPEGRQPTKIHWGIPDPAAVDGSEDERRAAFRAAYALLSKRVQRVMALPLATLTMPALSDALRAIAAEVQP